jgi:hypothetical protein
LEASKKAKDLIESLQNNHQLQFTSSEESIQRKSRESHQNRSHKSVSLEKTRSFKAQEAPPESDPMLIPDMDVDSINTEG